MSIQKLNRRKVLQYVGAAAGALVANQAAGNSFKNQAAVKYNFTYSLNMATIRGHKLGFVKELETASAAGFRSVEIWMDSFQTYLDTGGTVAEARKRLDGLGIRVENCISFNKWIVDDETVRLNGVEQMKREMGMLAVLGCKRLAATGSGTSNSFVPELDVIAQRYRDILTIGESIGVIPQIEMWGFQKNLMDVSDVLYIAMKSSRSSARLLLDIFHLYKGNTAMETLPLMSPVAVDILHMNDYPATLSQEVITDAERIYPGDGAAPIKQILKILGRDGHPLVLSTELFNQAYYTMDALTVAKTSLLKMKTIVGQL